VAVGESGAGSAKFTTCGGNDMTGPEPGPGAEQWREEQHLSTADLHRLPLVLTALRDAFHAECGCLSRALDDNYRRSEFLFAERDPFGRLTQEFVHAELVRLNATIGSLLALAEDRLNQEGHEHGR
jgi:hypothetical protein